MLQFATTTDRKQGYDARILLWPTSSSPPNIVVPDWTASPDEVLKRSARSDVTKRYLAEIEDILRATPVPVAQTSTPVVKLQRRSTRTPTTRDFFAKNDYG